VSATELVRVAAQLALAPLALPVLACGALAARRDTLRRRRRGDKPRLLYGPTPIISIKYMRGAMAQAGYEARTVVYGSLPIFSQANYDYPLEHFFRSAASGSIWRRAPAMLLGPYRVFLWSLRRFDLFHFFFDGGLLTRTPLRFLEVQLLHLAGKKVVVFPYGGDVAALSTIRSAAWRRGIAFHYPELASRERAILRQIRYFCKRADFVVANIVHAESLPRRDLLTTLYYPIDTEQWKPVERAPDDGPVTILHAPNHRLLKGTDFLLDACRELEEEGLALELRLLEGVPNDELKRILEDTDIVAEQFLLGYALAAVEGMSLGKPVLSNLSDDEYYEIHRRETGLDECPIVSTTPEQIKDHLRSLITDPELRRSIGDAGRRYVLKYHSYEAMARMWELVYRKVWFGEQIELEAWHPDRAAKTGPSGETASAMVAR
jgi:glycosyltransferase involved in cell wall biosynthesis